MNKPPRQPEAVQGGELQVWLRERSLPPADPDALAQVLIDALADHWADTPEALRDAVLAVAAVLRTQP